MIPIVGLNITLRYSLSEIGLFPRIAMGDCGSRDVNRYKYKILTVRAE